MQYIEWSKGLCNRAFDEDNAMRYIDKLKHELADSLYDIMKCDLNSPQERILSDDKVQLYKKKMAYIFKNVIDSGMEGKDIVNRFAKTILPLFLSELNK